ncbi:MAG: hypothetical protein QF599_00385 [Planctomycetota bacterium]|jgi:hypothetical protein|nr:hypothetical protein [Planctomycetota bacterium]
MQTNYPTRNLSDWFARRAEEDATLYDETSCAAAWTGAIGQVVLTIRNKQRELTYALDNYPAMRPDERREASAKVGVLSEIVMLLEDLR